MCIERAPFIRHHVGVEAEVGADTVTEFRLRHPVRVAAELEVLHVAGKVRGIELADDGGQARGRRL